MNQDIFFVLLPRQKKNIYCVIYHKKIFGLSIVWTEIIAVFFYVFFHLTFIALCNSLPSHLNWLPSGRISYISELEHGWFFCDASVSWNWTCCLFFCSGFCFFLKELDRKLKNQKILFEIICRIKLFSFIRSAHDMKLYIKFREILPSLIFPCTKNKSKWATHAFSYETDKTYSRVTYKCLFSLKAEPFS